MCMFESFLPVGGRERREGRILIEHIWWLRVHHFGFPELLEYVHLVLHIFAHFVEIVLSLALRHYLLQKTYYLTLLIFLVI